MSFKKNPTIEELKDEVSALQNQVVNLNAIVNRNRKNFEIALEKNVIERLQPLQEELNVLKGKWWYKLITWSW